MTARTHRRVASLAEAVPPPPRVPTAADVTRSKMSAPELVGHARGLLARVGAAPDAPLFEMRPELAVTAADASRVLDRVERKA